MSKQQGFVGKAMNVAYHAVAIKNIIKALMKGGWAAAALQGIKYYWPQILTIVCVLLILPLIIYTCLPMMLFGFEGSTDPQITEMTAKASQVSEYFDDYERYCDERTNEISTQTVRYVNNGYETIVEGELMTKNWFIALFSVSVRNNLTGVSEQQIIDFVDNCIIFEVVTADNEEPELVESSNKVIIKRLSAEETMERMNFSDSDKKWSNLIFNTIESEVTNGNESIYPN